MKGKQSKNTPQTNKIIYKNLQKVHKLYINQVHNKNYLILFLQCYLHKKLKKICPTALGQKSLNFIISQLENVEIVCHLTVSAFLRRSLLGLFFGTRRKRVTFIRVCFYLQPGRK